MSDTMADLERSRESQLAMSKKATRSGKRIIWGRLLRSIALHVVVVTASFLFVLPFAWMVSTSLKDDAQTFHVPPIWIPNPVRWSNYPEALTYLPFGRYVVNTLAIAACSVIGGTLSSALGAYGFSRIRWRGRDTFFFITLATMMIPFQVQMIPLFLTFRQLGWLNTFLPLIVPAFGGSPYFIFLLRQFFLSIPQDLSDAARVDGCNEIGILLRIILPLARPALAVVALQIFLWAWNDYLGPLIYINDESKYTLALGIQLLRTSTQAIMRLAWPYLMAASTVTIFPVVAIFFLAQRTFIEGITLTGVKG